MSEAYWGLEQNLKTTPLYNVHNDNRAKLVPFAGYYLPIQYENGIIAEHNHTRNSVSIFDVSYFLHFGDKTETKINVHFN